jgi:4-amino-4-deoxy-L-arabinose transferase-like glycosyltransferase
MNKNTLIPIYLLMLVVHVGHVFEEIWGRFWIMNAALGLGRFLVMNWVLFCIPVALFYGVLRGKHWAYTLSMAYAVIMILNGVGHNVATLVTGRYWDGFAGGVTGIGLILIGLSLLYLLRKEKPDT